MLMQTTLTLKAKKAGFFLGHAVNESTGGMDISDRDLALMPQGMIG